MMGHTETHYWYTDLYLCGRHYRHVGIRHHEKAAKHLEILRRLEKQKKRG